MTKLEKLQKINSLITELILSEGNRKYNEHQRYEQRKARNQCTVAKSCKRAVVPYHTMCSFHLRKAAIASQKRYRKIKCQ